MPEKLKTKHVKSFYGNFLISHDKFGKRQQFLVSSKKKFRSVIGSAVTIISFVLIVLFFYRKIVILANNKQPGIIFNRVFGLSYSRIDLEEKDFIVAFSVKLNNTLLNPSKFKDYLTLIAFQQPLEFSADSENNLITTTTQFNLTFVPCWQHSKKPKIDDMIGSDLMMKQMIMNFSFCLNRNLSLADDKNISKLTTIGGGLQNLPLDHIRLLIGNCSKKVNPSCIGIKDSDKLDIQMYSPELDFDLEKRETPLEYTMESFQTISVIPSLTKYYGVFLALYNIFDATNPFQANKLVSSLPHIEKVTSYPGKLPNTFVSLAIRGERTQYNMTRQYYSFMDLNTDFGSILQAISILVLLLYHAKATRDYNEEMKNVVRSAIKPSSNLNKTDCRLEYLETSFFYFSESKQIFLKNSLLTKYQKKLITVNWILWSEKHFLETKSTFIRKQQTANTPFGTIFQRRPSRRINKVKNANKKILFLQGRTPIKRIHPLYIEGQTTNRGLLDSHR